MRSLPATAARPLSRFFFACFPHIFIAAEVVALEALAQGIMSACDQLLQHVAET